MRRKKYWIVALVGLTTITGIAAAAVPGWARTWRATSLDIQGCRLRAAQAIQSVTGSATSTKTNDYQWEVRGFTANAGVFAYCTALPPPNICPNRPRANLTILAFSSAGSGNAATVRNQVDSAFGNPVLTDCN